MTNEWPLVYCPETGVLTWRVTTGARGMAGAKAGSVRADGYRAVKVRGRLYKAARVAWFCMTGAWPAEEIDHINGDRDDNRWGNLREVSRAVNMQNIRRAQKRSVLGVLGVSRHRRKYRACIKKDGKSTYLGLYETAELAHAAYVAAKRELHPGNTL